MSDAAELAAAIRERNVPSSDEETNGHALFRESKANSRTSEGRYQQFKKDLAEFRRDFRFKRDGPE